jgi:hypothetical protein
MYRLRACTPMRRTDEATLLGGGSRPRYGTRPIPERARPASTAPVSLSEEDDAGGINAE